MKVGIIGYSASGKTSLFNALTGLHAETGGFSSKGNKNLGQIKVPDPRLDKLAAMHNPKKLTYAEIGFIDFVGHKMGDSTQGFDPQTVADIRVADALVVVLRGFETPLASSAANPAKELENIISEMMLNDLMPIEKRLERVAKEGAKGKEEEALLLRLKTHLENDKPLNSMELKPEELARLSGFNFLSVKPLVIALNHGEDDIGKDAFPECGKAAAARGLPLLRVSAKTEMELNDLSPEERAEFMKDLGITEPAVNKLIKGVFDALNLIVFFTTGEDECRAWTVRRDATAVEAAAKVHTDIARGFIRAEVTHYADVMELGSEAACQKAGKMRLEGKEYVVQDGDIVHFRFNI